MKNTIDIAKVSTRGTAALSLGLIVSNVVMAAGTLLVASFLSEAEYGLYAIVLTVPALFSLFQDLGVNSAIIKYTAQYRAENRREEIKKILVTGLIFDAILGFCLSLIAFFSASFLAVTVVCRPEIKSLIEIASVVILFSSMITAVQSVFIGFERMKFNSLTMIFQSVLKCFASPALVLIGYGVYGAIMGAIVASAATTVLGIVIFLFSFYRKLEMKIDNFQRKFKESLSVLIRYGFPISVSTIASGFQTQFYNFLVYRAEPSNVSIANYQMATNFMVLLGFLTTPITTVLFPAFSKLNIEQDGESLRRIFQLSVKYSSLIVTPAATALMVLSGPFVGTLFVEKFNVAPFYLSLLAIQGLFVGIGNLSINNLINSQGKTTVTLKLTLLTFSVGVSLSLLLIPFFRIIGLIVTVLIAGIPSLIIGFWWIRKHFNASIDVVSSAKIYLSSGIAGALTYYIVINLSSLPFWIGLVAGGTFIALFYMVSVSLTHAIDKNDVSNLREMLREIGPALKIINPILKIVEKISVKQKINQ
ncbi:MAG: oligosaccharide flippase family protein [Candidatus Bathyarchaeia archaeon]